jgi:hypothetical protein
MAVDKANVVDAVGVDKTTGEVVLTISDHLAWDDARHLRLLEDKLNHYLGFIEQGELTSAYPDAAGRAIRIDIVCRYQPSAEAVNLLTKAKDVTKTYGSALSWRVHAA